MCSWQLFLTAGPSSYSLCRVPRVNSSFLGRRNLAHIIYHLRLTHTVQQHKSSCISVKLMNIFSSRCCLSLKKRAADAEIGGKLLSMWLVTQKQEVFSHNLTQLGSVLRIHNGTHRAELELLVLAVQPLIRTHAEILLKYLVKQAEDKSWDHFFCEEWQR